MIELLDSNAQRMSNIVKKLGEDREWNKTAELAVLLNVSQRTVSNDLKMIKERWGTLLNFESSLKDGVRINNYSIISQETIIKALISESTAINLIELIFNQPYNNLDYYAEEIFTSRSTLLRVIPKINSFFRNLNFQIISDHSGYYFIADNEIHLRKFFARFFTELYDTDITRFKNELNFEFVTQFVQKIISNNKFAINDVAYSLFSFIVIVTLTRENQGFTYHIDPKRNRIKITESTLQSFLHDFPYITADSIRSLEFGIMEYRHSTHSEMQDKVLSHAILTYFNELQETFEIQINVDDRTSLEMFLSNLYYKFQTYPFESSILFNRVKKFSLSIQKENPHLIERFSPIAFNFASSLSLNYEHIIDDLIYFTISQLPEIITTPIGIKHILYLSDLGSEHGNFIARLIKGTFYPYKQFSNLEIEVASREQPIKKSYLNQYDCILTTLPNLNYPLDHILQINDYPTDQDLFNIFQLLKKD